MKGIIDSCAWMCLCYLCNRSIRLIEYIDTEAIQRKHNSQTCKQNKFNKEFTQCSWATSPGPTFQWWPLYYVFKQIFYIIELDWSLTNKMKSVGMECTDSPY